MFKFKLMLLAVPMIMISGIVEAYCYKRDNHIYKYEMGIFEMNLKHDKYVDKTIRESKDRNVFLFKCYETNKNKKDNKGRFTGKGNMLDKGKNLYAHGKYYSVYSDGNEYFGDFRNAERHGYGIYRWSYDNYYKGSWKDGEMHGEGTYYYVNTNFDKTEDIMSKGTYFNGNRNGIHTFEVISGIYKGFKYQYEYEYGIRLNETYKVLSKSRFEIDKERKEKINKEQQLEKERLEQIRKNKEKRLKKEEKYDNCIIKEFSKISINQKSLPSILITSIKNKCKRLSQ